LLVALMPDAPLRLEEGLLERFADEFFRLAHRYGGEPLVVSRSGVLARVRGPRGGPRGLPTPSGPRRGGGGPPTAPAGGR
jgi:hypothetical protein